MLRMNAWSPTSVLLTDLFGLRPLRHSFIKCTFCWWEGKITTHYSPILFIVTLPFAMFMAWMRECKHLRKTVIANDSSRKKRLSLVSRVYICISIEPSPRSFRLLDSGLPTYIKQGISSICCWLNVSGQYLHIGEYHYQLFMIESVLQSPNPCL